MAGHVFHPRFALFRTRVAPVANGTSKTSLDTFRVANSAGFCRRLALGADVQLRVEPQLRLRWVLSGRGPAASTWPLVPSDPTRGVVRTFRTVPEERRRLVSTTRRVASRVRARLLRARRAPRRRFGSFFQRQGRGLRFVGKPFERKHGKSIRSIDRPRRKTFVETNVNSFRVNSSPSKTESSDQGEGTINSSACGSPTT